MLRFPITYIGGSQPFRRNIPFFFITNILLMSLPLLEIKSVNNRIELHIILKCPWNAHRYLKGKVMHPKTRRISKREVWAPLPPASSPPLWVHYSRTHTQLPFRPPKHFLPFFTSFIPVCASNLPPNPALPGLQDHCCVSSFLAPIILHYLFV